MGKRGPGAKKLVQARRPKPGGPRVLPWKKRGLSRYGRVVAFLEWLPITKGKLCGKTMRLLPHQKSFLKLVYGNKSVRLAIQSAPRGNGKTGLLAGLALCHLLGPEAEQRGAVFSAAIDRQQAGIMFDEMEAIIHQVPEFAERVNIQRFHKKIEVDAGDGEGSVYEALSSDARRAHGLAPSLWVYDELAQAKDRELLDNLMTAMGKRDRSLGIVISTQAPDNYHPLSELIDDAEHDPSIVLQLTAAPEGADPFDPEVIRACNPALGVFLDEADVMAQAEMARRNQAYMPAHRNLRLNQRVDSSVDQRVVTREVWELGNVPVDAEALRGRECDGGCDLSTKHDLTALLLSFPDAVGGVDVLSFFWTPEGQLEKRRTAERDLFKRWIREGHLKAVPGDTIHLSWVARQIADLSTKYKIRRIFYDKYRIDQLKHELEAIGCNVALEEHQQGFISMGTSMSNFHEKALAGKIRHGGHPVLAASIDAAVVVSDAAGNLKFDKNKSSRASSIRIDGAVALVMSLADLKKREAEYQMLFIG